MVIWPRLVLRACIIGLCHLNNIHIWFHEWSAVRVSVLGRTRRCVLVGGGRGTGGRLRGFKSPHHAQSALSLVLVDEMYPLGYCSSAMPACLPPAAMLSAVRITDSL